MFIFQVGKDKIGFIFWVGNIELCSYVMWERKKNLVDVLNGKNRKTVFIF